MQKLALVRLVGMRLSGREPEDMEEFVDAEAALVQEGILEGKPFIPWFLSKKDVLDVGKATQGLVDLPEGFLTMDLEEGVFLRVDAENVKELAMLDIAEARRHFSGIGAPVACALEGENKIRFFPEPDKDYEVEFSYYGRAKAWTDLEDEEENQWLRHAADLFAAELGKVCAEILRDKDAFQLFERRVREGWANLEYRHLERRLAGQELTF